MSRADPPGEARAVTLLHTILTGSLVVIVLAMSMVVWLRGGPLLEPDRFAALVAYISTGIALTIVAIAVAVIRAQLPETGRSGSDYWNPGTRKLALLLWIMCENGGTLAAVGYILTGHLAPLIGAAIAVLTMVWYSPRRISGA